ncbi:DUF268 domain-containing protein [Polynucleobacter paneuropaeus]|nr:DUF268 domain-containing protein [Polynucleobacter paneuropaeus]
MPPIFRRLYWFLSSQLGLDPRNTFYSLFYTPRFLRDFLSFRHNFVGRIELMPCLHDWLEEGGATKNEYFWQDLYFAQKIFIANPKKHIDIGSRVDGFVAHVASYREIEIFDIRKISPVIQNIKFKQADLTSRLVEYEEYADSLSCLHALEHFGLGRYGDKIDVEGYKSGLENMSKLLRKNGRFYLSTPIGVERVMFNAHRIFNPFTIERILKDNGMKMEAFAYFCNEPKIIESQDFSTDMHNLSKLPYTLGMFTFIKE